MSSPPMDFPSSELGDTETQEVSASDDNPLFLGTPSATPLHNVAARRALGLSTPQSDPLHFPSSALSTPAADATGAPKDRRGDIHSSLRVTPTPSTRPTAQSTKNANRDIAGLFIPPSSTGQISAQQLSAAIPSSEPDEIRAIWGTNVNLAQTMRTFREFLHGFKPKYRIAFNRESGLTTYPLSSPEEGEHLLYETYLRRMRQTGQTNLNVDVINILSYPPSKKLHSQLIKYPQEVIPAMDQVLKDVMIELADEDATKGVEGMQGKEGEEEMSDILSKVYKVRPFGEKPGNMRELNPSDTDKLVCIKGLVIRATPIIPDMKVAFFRCLTCLHTVQVEIDRGRIDEPSRCPRDVCAMPGSMTLVHNRCEFADRQVLRLQETPDAVPDGQTPQTVSLCVYDELVDVAKPGDRLIITGIFRSVPVRVNPRQRTLKSLFKTFLDVVHVRRGGGGRLGFDKSTRPGAADRLPGIGSAGVGGGDDEDEEDAYTRASTAEPGQKSRKEELEAMLVGLSKRPDIYNLLARSLAPSIWEMDDVKKGILLQLFGGTNKSVARGGGGGGPRYRGDINVLLVGDPGAGKSQILQYVHKIAPRGVYTSGKGSSAVGLTAYVTRDPDSKQLVLESGALVLSDGGVCCIDEFDKMSDSTRSVLHEVMEQQTVSIAKAGIITTLNARTSILAAANPVGSKYVQEWPITRNIDLPPTLISRFDLLYLVLDNTDEVADRRLAQHLVGLYLEDAPETGGNDTLPLDELSAYITYARSHVYPVITEEASKELVRAYVELRNMGHDPRTSERRITATTRQLESMIRLSEAHARSRLSGFVELGDVQEACRLMRDAIRTSATDPRTGQIDMDLINTGTSLQQRKMRRDLRREILSLLEGNSGLRGIRWLDLVKQLGGQSSIAIDVNEFAETIKGLETEGIVKVVGERERRTIKKVEGA
ncbi:MCM-domain-containing protein [Fomitiporia mediterranea MF3/22]|uniref:MCM-domain-containing protein n=1 Tax=Fomitiporia mediterranea (strain MF3/22) TaxID=694068 RepID=UPI0004408D29|nr:MCM-domain-containing protein [Fomitiporia mediterranea MF3/22]EJD05304.1 MCM-domain-containing protein [Fomitiporia mediterranea MF3/22]